MPGALIDTVSDTAFGVAHYRAEEGERHDALFRDPLARRLAGEKGRQIAQAMPMPVMARQMVVIRTCIIDAYIQTAISKGVDTILNLGAGLDTRPYRMQLPKSLVWIEVDYPHVIDFKEERLSGEEPHCQLQRVKLDLGNIEERQRLFTTVNAHATRLLILTEGVVAYLTVDQVSSLLTDFRLLDRARYWVVEYSSPELVRYRQKRRIRRRMHNAPFRFNVQDWFGFFEQHGWCPADVKYLAEEAERLQRPLQYPLILRIRRLLSSPQRRRRMERFLGYCVLQRC